MLDFVCKTKEAVLIIFHLSSTCRLF